MPLARALLDAPGWIGRAILALGFLGAILAVTAAVALILRPRVALWLGVAALALGAVPPVLGGIDTLERRKAADTWSALRFNHPIEQERVHRKGHIAARRSARAGAVASSIPLLLGTAVMLAALVRVARRGQGEGSAAWLAATIALPTAGALAGGFALWVLRAPLPGRDLDPDDPRWRVLADVDHALHGNDRDLVDSGCHGVEHAYLIRAWGLPSPDLESIPDLPKAAARCFDMKRAEMLSAAKDIEDRHYALAKLEVSPMLVDPAQRRQVEEDLAALVRIWPLPPWMVPRATPLGTPSAGVRLGAPAVTGELPADVIERFVGSMLQRFRDCYHLEARRMFAEGDVVVRFVIDRSGSAGQVEDAGSTFPARDTVRCVIDLFEIMRFPPPPRQSPVKVVYPLHFTPPAVKG